MLSWMPLCYECLEGQAGPLDIYGGYQGAPDKHRRTITATITMPAIWFDFVPIAKSNIFPLPMSGFHNGLFFSPPPTLQNRGRFLFSLMGGCHAPILIGCEIKAYYFSLILMRTVWIDTFPLYLTLICQSQEDIFLLSFNFISLPLYFLLISFMLTSASPTSSVYFTIVRATASWLSQTSRSS